MPSTRSRACRGSATLTLHQVEFVPGRPWLGAEDLVALHPGLEVQETDHVLLLAGAVDLDTAALTAHLGEVAVHLGGLMPFLDPPARPPQMVILPDERAYQHYVVRLAEAFHAETTPPTRDGYTLQGIATGAMDSEQAGIRPSWTHEYVHAWLSAASRLPRGTGDWLQEGLAVYVQLAFHPQETFDAIVRAGLEDSGKRMALTDLLDGGRVPRESYWQAATVVAYLLEEHADALPALMGHMSETGSVNMRQHLEPLGVDMGGLESSWMEWARGRYATDQ